MRKQFHYLSTTAAFYFLTFRQALAANTGAALPAIEQPVKMWSDTLTGPLAVNFTAVACVVAGFMYANSNHGPGTTRVGSWVVGGGIACSVIPIMGALGMTGARF